MAVDIYLTTERLTLCWLTPADVDDLYALDSDPEVMRYLTGGKPSKRDNIERTLHDRYDREAGYGRWAARETATGTFIGWFALSRAEVSDAAAQRPVPPRVAAPHGVSSAAPPHEAELGYRLRRDAWGKGYAVEGSRALLHKAFTELGTQRVWAETMAVNTRSRKVMERAGLRFVRVFHADFDDPIEGTEHGEVEYEIRRADWLARR
jgi:RimJ/RimL family protein N-acetyltransferase